MLSVSNKGMSDTGSGEHVILAALPSETIISIALFGVMETSGTAVVSAKMFQTKNIMAIR